MDAQTISATQGAFPEVYNTRKFRLSRKQLAVLYAQFSGHSADQLEQECKALMQTSERLQISARTMIEQGKRLIVLKLVTPRGNYSRMLQRIDMDQRMAQRTIESAGRLMYLPNSDMLIDSANKKTKIFALLALGDKELVSLAEGGTVRGITLSHLPIFTAEKLIEKLKMGSDRSDPRELAARTPVEILPSASAPVTPPNSSAVVGLATAVPLLAGDKVKSLHTGRTGKVVKVYSDGSACVCWDDGEPQAEGLGHERMPRDLLIRLPAIEEATVGTADQGNSPARIDGFSYASPMIIGELSSDALSSAEDDPVSQAMDEDSAELRAILDRQANAYAKAHNVSYGEAIGMVGGQAIGELVRLSGEGDDISSPETGAVAGTDTQSNRPTQSGVTLNQSFKQLNMLQNHTWDMLSRISTHLKALSVVVNDNSTTTKSIDVGTLIEIGSSIVEPYSELLSDMEDVIMDIERRLLREPEPGILLQESVWLELVAELATDRKTFEQKPFSSGEDKIKLQDLATNLLRFASSSPEVSAALGHLQSAMACYGVSLYEHGPSNSMCFKWIPGQEPFEKHRAAMSH